MPKTEKLSASAAMEVDDSIIDKNALAQAASYTNFTAMSTAIASGKTFNASNFGSYVVSFGKMDWWPVRVTAENGNIVLTLWLKTSIGDYSFSDGTWQYIGGEYACNNYKHSWIRAAINAGQTEDGYYYGSWRNSSSVDYKPTYYTNSNKSATASCAPTDFLFFSDFVGVGNYKEEEGPYAKYIIKGGDYDDYLWLPAVGEAATGGSWGCTTTQWDNNGNTDKYWTRSVLPNSPAYGIAYLDSSGSDELMEQVQLTGGVRPAINVKLGEVSEVAPPDKPTEDTSVFTYNGSQQTYNPVGFDEETMQIIGNEQTNAGTYTVTVTPFCGVWSDGDTEPVKFTFVIAEPAPDDSDDNQGSGSGSGSTDDNTDDTDPNDPNNPSGGSGSSSTDDGDDNKPDNPENPDDNNPSNPDDNKPTTPDGDDSSDNNNNDSDDNNNNSGNESSGSGNNNSGSGNNNSGSGNNNGSGSTDSNGGSNNNSDSNTNSDGNSGAAAVASGIKNFFKKNWLWLLIALAAIVLLIIIIAVAKKSKKSAEERAAKKEAKEEEKQRKAEEKARRDEERRLQKEKLDAERELAKARQEAELEKIRAQAGMGAASMAMAQPYNVQPSMGAQPQPIIQQVPAQDNSAILRLEMELAEMRSKLANSQQQPVQQAPQSVVQPQPIIQQVPAQSNLDLSILAEMRADIAEIKAKQSMPQMNYVPAPQAYAPAPAPATAPAPQPTVAPAQAMAADGNLMTLMDLKLQMAEMKSAQAVSEVKAAQAIAEAKAAQQPQPQVMPQAQVMPMAQQPMYVNQPNSMDALGALVAATLKNLAGGERQVQVKPSAPVPPDAVVTTTTTVDRTKNKAVRSDQNFDVDGFYDKYE